MTKKNKAGFENALERLEVIVSQLEAGEITLEESMKVFEEGEELIKFCLKELEHAEKKVQKLKLDEKGEFQLELVQ